MRTRINIDSATPEEIKNLTTALQNVTLRDVFTDEDDRHPHIWVHDGGMGWESPSISRQRAADVLREFDRLDAGLFDSGLQRERLELRVKPGETTLREVMKAGGSVVLDEFRGDDPADAMFIDRAREAMKPGDRPEGVNTALDEDFLLGAKVYYDKRPYTIETFWKGGSVSIGQRNEDGSRKGTPIRVPMSEITLAKDDEPTITDEVDMAEAAEVGTLAGSSEDVTVQYTATHEEGHAKPWVVRSVVLLNKTEVVGPPVFISRFETQAEADAEVTRLTGNLPK